MLAASFSTNGANPQQGSSPMPQGNGTPQARALNGFQPPAPPTPLTPPTNQHIKSHTIMHPDGTKIVQSYHNPAEQKKNPGVLNKQPIESEQAPQSSAQPPMPEVKQIGNTHHVPYRKPDGSYGFIDAQGNTH